MAVVVSAAPVTGQRIEIVTFVPSQIMCAETPMPGTGVVMSLPVVVNRYGPAIQSAPALVLRYDFVIDADGRTRTIRRTATASTPGYYVNTSDIAPSLAVSRFPAGDPRSKCSITYTGLTVPIDAAPLQVLYELASRPETEGTVGTVYDRLRPVGSDCRRGPGQYRRLNLPAFEKIARPPGAASWVFLAYDVDRAGKPNNVRVLGSSGNQALDRAGASALSNNRYEPGIGFTGCTYHFNGAESSERTAPELPADAPRDNGEQPGCVVDPTSISALLNGSAYPSAFARRRIKGVAVVGYDTAPWGAIGNVRILASEPDEAFGEAARSVLSSARVSESATGRRGCIRRVRFELSPVGVARQLPYRPVMHR